MARQVLDLEHDAAGLNLGVGSDMTVHNSRLPAVRHVKISYSEGGNV